MENVVKSPIYPSPHTKNLPHIPTPSTTPYPISPPTQSFIFCGLQIWLLWREHLEYKLEVQFHGIFQGNLVKYAFNLFKVIFSLKSNILTKIHCNRTHHCDIDLCSLNFVRFWQICSSRKNIFVGL